MFASDSLSGAAVVSAAVAPLADVLRGTKKKGPYAGSEESEEVGGVLVLVGAAYGRS